MIDLKTMIWLVQLLNCNHIFCTDCTNEYLNEEIKNSRVLEIKCPFKDCKFTYSEDNLKNIVKDEVLYKYKKFLLREKYKNNPNFIICPIVNCEGYADKTINLPDDEQCDLLSEENFNKNITAFTKLYFP